MGKITQDIVVFILHLEIYLLMYWALFTLQEWNKQTEIVENSANQVDASLFFTGTPLECFHS